jgi:hypothetical protein
MLAIGVAVSLPRSRLEVNTAGTLGRMQLLGECVTHGAPICLSSLSWALEWRGTAGDYTGVVKRLPAGDFGHTAAGEYQSYFFRMHSTSAYVLLGEQVKYIVDVVASDPEDPLPTIWNEIEALGERVSHIHFEHSVFVYSLATDMSRELPLHFTPSGRSSVRSVPFFWFPAKQQGYNVHFREVFTGPVDYRVLALQTDTLPST